MFLRFSFVVLLFTQYCAIVNAYPCIFRDEIKKFTDEPQKAFNDGVTAVRGDSRVEVPSGIFQHKMESNVVPSLESAVNSTTDRSSSKTWLHKNKRQSGDEPSVSESIDALGASKLTDVKQSLMLNATTNAHLRNDKLPVSVNNSRSSSISNGGDNRWSRANQALLQRFKSLFSTNDNNDARNKRSVDSSLVNDDGEEETSAEQNRDQSEELYDELVEKDLDTTTTESN